jgi:hypothetical protein
VFEGGYDVLTVDRSDELQLLRTGGADGDDHPTGVAELSEQSRRKIGSSSRDKDGIKRGAGGKTECAVSRENADIGIAKSSEKVAGAVGEGWVAFDGEYLRRQFSEQSGDIAGTSSNFEDLVGGSELERFEHAGNDVGLRDGLAVTDGQRMILVGLASISFRDELMTRDREHDVEDTRVRDAASPELGIDHELTRGGRFGHERWPVVSGQRSVNKTTGCRPLITGHRPLLSFPAVADAHVEADHPILVAVADEGNVAIHIVLPLDDLL